MKIYLVHEPGKVLLGTQFTSKIAALRYIRYKLNTNNKEKKSLKYLYSKSWKEFRCGRYALTLKEIEVREDHRTFTRR